MPEACLPHDLDLDLVVVGSGIAGLVSALTAAVAGRRVAVLEKTAWFGGTSAYSEAMVWAPLSAQARDAGAQDTFEAAERYLHAVVGARAEAALLGAYVRHAAAALAFVEAEAPVRYALTPGSIDYYPDRPGATAGQRALSPLPYDGRRLGSRFRQLRPPLASTTVFGGMMVTGPDLPHFYRLGRSLRSTAIVGRRLLRHAADRLAGYPRGTVLAGGNAVVAGLLWALDRRGVPLITAAPVERLLLDADRVIGVSVLHAGRRLTVRAGAVVLASGGFPASPLRRQQHFLHVALGQSHHTLAAEGGTGDGIAMARAAGAALQRGVAQAAAWAPASLLPTRRGAVPFPHFGDRAKPGIIAVDRKGRRFVSEAVSYHEFVPALTRACVDAREAECWLVADHRAQRRYGLGAAPPFPGRLAPYLRSGYLACAPTLGELADRVGIDRAGLQATCAEFNTAAARGEDPRFGRGGDAYQRANGDPQHGPNPCLAPLLEAPFYAVRVVPGDLGTFAGLRTDASARVLREDDTPIGGLYAVGTDMGSVMGGSYPAAGITVGSGMTFGWLAARHAAAAGAAR